MKAVRLVFCAAITVAAARETQAEPIFLARQYTRCITCHYSPTGGGLLTPYGRSLTEQLSTMGPASGTSDPARPSAEPGLLWGRLGNHLGPLDLGIDVRPAHLDVNASGFSTTENFLMTADLMAAIRTHGWTFYGEIGREPVPDGPKIASYEYWVGHESDHGIGFRVGRFLPAYGIRLADHTALTRLNLGFDVYDQILGLELSHASERHLLQVSVSPGSADSALHNDGRRALTTTGRFQLDLNTRTALVFSGLFHDASQIAPSIGEGGVAFGIAPLKRLSVWTEADVVHQGSTGAGSGSGTGYTLLNETSFEVYRGLWLKLSPQFRTDPADSSRGTFRTVVEADLYPRTHFNVDISLYRDVDRASSLSTRTILAQLHLYL